MLDASRLHDELLLRSALASVGVDKEKQKEMKETPSDQIPSNLLSELDYWKEKMTETEKKICRTS